MKSVSKAALAAVLLAGVPAATGFTPALAQKKDEKAQDLKLSAEFRKPAAEIQKLAEAKDWAGVKAQIDALDAVAKTEDEKFFAANFRLQAAANTNDTPSTITALDALIANPKTPQADRGRFNFFRGDFASKAKKPADALAYFTKARELGYVPNGVNMTLLIAQTQFDAGQRDAGIASIDTAIKAEEAAGRKAPENWYKLVVSKLYTSGNKAAAADWLGRQIAAYPSPEAWRSSMLIYLEQLQDKGVQLDPDQRLDVLRLMRASKAMGGESDYLQYADVAQRRGLPGEVKSVIDEGRASGKVTKTNDAQLPQGSRAVPPRASEGWRGRQCREHAPGHRARAVGPEGRSEDGVRCRHGHAARRDREVLDHLARSAVGLKAAASRSKRKGAAAGPPFFRMSPVALDRRFRVRPERPEATWTSGW